VEKKKKVIFLPLPKDICNNSQTTFTVKVIRVLEVTFSIIAKNLLIIRNDRSFSVRMTALHIQIILVTGTLK